MIKEDELAALEAGVKSDFWKLLVEKFYPTSRKTLRELRDRTTTERDWLAGRLDMVDEILEYPVKRIAVLSKPVEKDA